MIGFQEVQGYHRYKGNLVIQKTFINFDRVVSIVRSYDKALTYCYYSAKPDDYIMCVETPEQLISKFYSIED